jgi:MFS family permease
MRTLALASIGGALEFYDFVIFVFFTPVIGKLFFADSLADWVRQAQAFGIFAAGYLARPIGGIVMAHFGDTDGRKRMFTLRAFPAPIRFSGFSFSYNVAYALFGGLTPLLVTWLAHLDRTGPAYYVAAVTLVGLGATLSAPSHGLSNPARGLP